MGGLWEFPGGKIEPGETVTECIVREIREELAIEITVSEHLITIEHTYPAFQITLIVHHCQHIGGIPQSIESDEIRWVNVNDLASYQFPAANLAIIQAIESGVNGEIVKSSSIQQRRKIYLIDEHSSIQVFGC